MSIKLNIQKFAEGNTDPDPNTNGGNNADQNGGNDSEPKTYTQEDLDKIVNERTGRATKSALSSFFKQKGLTEEEANTAITAYLDNKAKNTPDVSALQNSLTAEKRERLQAEINSSATLEAIKQGVDVKSIPYVLKMSDFKDCADEKGNINAEKLSNAIKTVLDAVPALKGASADGSASGVQVIGGDGSGNQNRASKTSNGEVPTKKWNRFNN